MKKISLLLSVCLSYCSLSLAESKTQFSVNSDYYFRGIGYERDTSSISFLGEYQSELGVYAGVWLSRLDTERDLYYQQEFDFWLGYSDLLNEDWLADISLVQYAFPGDWPRDYDWQELQVNLHFQEQWSLGFGINRNQYSFDKRGQYLEITRRQALPWHFIVDASVGAVDTEVLLESYFYYQIGVSQQFASAQIRLAWINADGGNPEIFRRVRADNEWQLGLSYTF